jgi:hypothetical protein
MIPTNGLKETILSKNKSKIKKELKLTTGICSGASDPRLVPDESQKRRNFSIPKLILGHQHHSF